MSRSIVLPLLALGCVILYGTTRAAGPVPEPVLAEESRSGLVVLDEGEPMRPLPPQPPPAPRLRSEEAPPPAPEPLRPDSAAEVVPTFGDRE